MDFEKLWDSVKAIFKSKEINLGDNEDAVKAELKKVIDETPKGEEVDLSKLDLSKFQNSDNGKVLEAVINKYSSLEASVNKLVDYMQTEADARKTEKEKFEADQKAQKEKDVKAAVDYVINDKKAFSEAQRDHLTKLAESDIDSFKTVYGAAKSDKHFTDGKDGKDGKEGKEGGDDNKSIVKSTAGNATALKAIQEHQATSEN